MALTKDELEKSENDFRYLIDKYVHYFIIYNQLITKNKRTAEEEQEFLMIHELLLSIGEVLAIAIRALGDELFGNAIDLYYHYKQIANKGNRDAQFLVKELKPLLAISLNSRINMN